jgi:hypothetical protein
MLPRFRTSATAALTALSLALALPAPAHAWGERQQNTLAALVAAGLIGTLIYQNSRQRQYAAPVTRAPAPQYPASRTSRYQEPVAYGSAPISGVSATPAARAFNSYTPAQRRAIQSRLSEAGYYHGGIDGTFGPKTYQAIMAIAGDTSGTGQLTTMSGALEFYDAILG